MTEVKMYTQLNIFDNKLNFSINEYKIKNYISQLIESYLLLEH